MTTIKVADDLWASAILPEGTVERWIVSNGAIVRAGEAMVQIRIEDALHDVAAPMAGRLVIAAHANSMLEPGTVLGELLPVHYGDIKD